MFVVQAVVVSILLGPAWSAEDLTFPPGFKFGAATASYQVEGAWNVSDKGESIWDRYTHANPDAVVGRANGDVACDSYHHWRRDVEMASELGLEFYRFSLSWPRILPSGFSNYISEDGVSYYNNLIDGLLEKGIEPFITLYHWDLPQKLQDLGGWTNPLIMDWFGDYARVAYSLFGDRVKLWLTFNEPLVVCDFSYSGLMAPGIKEPEMAVYLCNKNLLMAHAKAWRIYDEEFRHIYSGEVSLCNHLLWMEPSSEEHEELTELARQHYTGRYSHPIFSKEGGWPSALEKIIAENSKKRGYTESRLPEFTEEEKEFIRGTFDFYGVNHYTSRLILKKEEKVASENELSWAFGDIPELGVHMEPHPDWGTTTSSWLYMYPEGIRRQLVWLKEHYGDIKFLITENGLATPSGLDDQDRVNYYKEYMKQILLAIKEDGVNVTHYTAWSLMDNFEWGHGYSVYFGLYEVDFNDPNRTRTPRASAKFYAEVIARRSLDLDVIKDEL